MLDDERLHVDDDNKLKSPLNEAGELQIDAGYDKPTSITHLIDIPLLVTMAAWFLMLYIGISKFIKANAMDYETHAKYIRNLGARKSFASIPHANYVRNVAAEQSYKIVTNTLKVAKSSPFANSSC